jgi:hypothetical protein
MVFLVLVLYATAETVSALMATTIEMRAAMLNSGTFGVGVDVDEVELVGVAVEGVPEETCVTVTVPGSLPLVTKTWPVPES